MAFTAVEVLEEFAEAAQLGDQSRQRREALDFSWASRERVVVTPRLSGTERVRLALQRGVETRRERAHSSLALAHDARKVERALDRGAARVLINRTTIVLRMEAEMLEQAPHRKKMPEVRDSKTHKFTVPWTRRKDDGKEETIIVDCYLSVGFYDDGRPGEVFLRVSRLGDEFGGAYNAFAIGVSMALQHGAPLEVVCQKYIGERYQPAGFTGNPEIPYAASIPDYVARYLILRWGSAEARAQLFPDKFKADASPAPTHQAEADAPLCHECGAAMVRSGSCFKCGNCGSTSGCS